jgi:hypothetical protein
VNGVAGDKEFSLKKGAKILWHKQLQLMTEQALEELCTLLVLFEVSISTSS